MKHSTAKDRHTTEELLGGAVCIGCSEFVFEDEQRSCSCPLGFLGSYKRCPRCDDVYFDMGGPANCRPCEGEIMEEAYMSMPKYGDILECSECHHVWECERFGDRCSCSVDPDVLERA